MRILNYELGNHYDKFGRIESNQIILAKPGKRALGVLNGVRQDTCNLTINLNNTWVLDFDVDRIVDGTLSNYYDRIEQKMELHLPGFGWFKITEEPVMSNDGNTETMSIHAESLEIEFQQYILKGFEVNTGTEWSLEYLAADNRFYYDDDKSYPFFRENVRFYRDTTAWENMMEAFNQTNKSEKALLDLIPTHPCIMDCWRIKYNIDNFAEAIEWAVAEGESSGKNMKVLESYVDKFKSLNTDAEKAAAQQTAFNLTRVYPEILNYIMDPLHPNQKITDIDYASYDEDVHEGDYTLEEILELELQRQKDLSLLTVIANHYGWKVGFVDDSVVADSDVEDDRIPLSQKVGSFQVDSENAYTFMTQEMASYFRCVFVFDTYQKTVNAYNINNIGEDTNIFLSFHNIQNSVERSGNDTIRTAFYIQGGEELNPLEANFGSNEIWDLSYYMNDQHFSQETIDKYNAWLAYREQQRPTYMDLAVQYRKQLDVVSEIYDRVPVDAADTTQYGTMSDEQLEEEKANYEALLRGIEALYVNDNNEFDISILQEKDPVVYQEYIIVSGSVLSSPRDALQYIRYDAQSDSYIFVDGNKDTSDYRLGNIDIYIHNRKISNGEYIVPSDSPDTAKKKTYYKQQQDYLDNYIYDFETYGDAYGVAELENRLQDLENKYGSLYTQGYAQPIEDEEEYDPYHQSQFELYEKYKNSHAQCEQVLEQRKQEYDDANDTLSSISKQMTELAQSCDITDAQFGFTDDEIELIKKYLYYTDYTNENMIITSISTPEEIVDTEYQLIKDAQEELYAVAHPQWTYSTSQDNLFLIAENDDWYGGQVLHGMYDDWRNNLVIGNFIHVGFREDDHLPDFVYVDKSDNQVKLRLIAVSLNPFMIDPTIDLTFSTMIQYKSRRNDFVDLLGLANGVGDNQITATFQSKKLDDSYQIDSSFIMKLLSSGAFQNYAAGSILGGSTVGGSVMDALVIPVIHAAEINVDHITGNIARFMETYTEYLDADQVVARVIDAQEGNFEQLTAKVFAASYAEIFNAALANATIDSQTVHDLVAGKISVADLAAGKITINENLVIESENGYLIMDGNRLQIGAHEDNEGNMIPQIQLGYATNNEPNLVFRDRNGDSGIIIGYPDNTGKPSIAIYDTEGNIMINSGGIAEAGNRVIADELIVNDMVKEGTLGKERMNFNVMEVGDDIVIEQIKYEDGSRFGNQYTTFEQDFVNAVGQFVDVIPSVELTGDQVFTIDADDNILPNSITIYANPRNGFVASEWLVDDVVNSGEFESLVSDKLNYITIPNSYMEDRNSATIKCQNASGTYDTITVHKLHKSSSNYTVVLDNEDIMFSTSKRNVPLLYQEAQCIVSVYQGATPVTDFTISDVVISSNGVNANATGNAINVSVSPSAPITNPTVITFNVNVGSTIIPKSLTVRRLTETSDAIIIPEYALSTSNTEFNMITGGSWTEIRPEPSHGQFLWYRYKESGSLINNISRTGNTYTITPDTDGNITLNLFAFANLWQHTVVYDIQGYDSGDCSVVLQRYNDSFEVDTEYYIDQISGNTNLSGQYYIGQYSNNTGAYSLFITLPSAKYGEVYYITSYVNDGYSNNLPWESWSYNDATPDSVYATKYSEPHYISTITNMISMMDAVNKSITNKIWQDDFEVYDTQVIRHRESEIKQSVDSINMTVSSIESVIDENGNNWLTSLKTDYEQTANEFHWLFENNGEQTLSMQLTNDGLNLVNGLIAVTDGNDTTTITPNSILSNTLTSADGLSTINLREGTFNFGQGALTWDGSTLSIGGYSKSDIINAFTEGALQIRDIEDEQSGYSTMYFDNGFADDDAMRSTKPWVNFLGHRVDVNSFSIELADIIVPDITQFVVYKIGNAAEYQYVVWYDVEHESWKAINVDYQCELDDWEPDNYMQEVPWQWNNDSDMVVAEFVKKSDGDVTYENYYPSKTYSVIQQKAMLQSWGIDGELTESTTINGGNIATDTITSLAISTDGIRSRNYQQTDVTITRTLPDDYIFVPTADGSISYDNIITFTYNGDVRGKTLRLSMEDINPSIVEAEIVCYYRNTSPYYNDLTSASNDYLLFNNNIPTNANEMTSMTLTLVIDNMNADIPYTITSYIADGNEHISWSSVTADDQQLDNVTETVTTPPIYSDTGTCFNLENSGFIRSKNFAIDGNGNAYFSGELQAASGTFSGELSAATGSFSGSITAEEGNIAGWRLSSDKIYKEISANDSVIGKQQYVHICSNFYSSENNIPYDPVFYVQFDNDDKFYVRSNGELFAKNANISGTINASDGVVGGWHIYSNRMENVCANGNRVTLFNGDNVNNDVFVVETNNNGQRSWPFWIHNDGEAYASNITIAGGVFSKTITCTGTISGGTISGATFTTGAISIGSNGYINMTNLGNGVGIALWNGSQGVYTGSSLQMTNSYIYIGDTTTRRVELNDTGIYYQDGNYRVINASSCNDYWLFGSGGGLKISGEVYFPGVGASQAQSGGSDVRIANINSSSGRIFHSGSSSIRYKEIQSFITNEDIEKLYSIPVYSFKYKDGYLFKEDERNGIAMPGFIAEDWDKVMPIAVNHLDDGSPEMWNSNIVVPLMFQMIKNEHERNDKLRAEVEELKQLVKQLTER